MHELIITFHGIGLPPRSIPRSERNVWVPLEWLDAVLEAMPPDGVSLAFDDGNFSDVEHALPALARHGRTARFFVLAGQLGDHGRLGTRDVSDLHRAGMTIGSHGLNHRNWRTISDAELRHELSDSRRALSEIVDAPVDEVACPFGSYDRRVLGALRAAGYVRAYTSDGGSVSTTAWLAARTTITCDRPLDRWLTLVAAGPSVWRDPVLQLKGWVKRLR